MMTTIATQITTTTAAKTRTMTITAAALLTTTTVTMEESLTMTTTIMIHDTNLLLDSSIIKVHTRITTCTQKTSHTLTAHTSLNQPTLALLTKHHYLLSHVYSQSYMTFTQKYTHTTHAAIHTTPQL